MIKKVTKLKLRFEEAPTTILFIGPVLSGFKHTKNSAASSATSEYIKIWITEIQKKYRLQHINFVPDRRWPLGSIVPSSGLEDNKNRIEANYINLPFLANFTKSISILFALIIARNKHGNLKTAIFFNWHYYYFPAYIFAYIFNIRCIILQADYRCPSFIKHVIYQNYSSFTNDSVGKSSCIYFPGFQDVKNSNSNKLFRIIAYAGGYGAASNISNFIEWFIKTELNCELRLFGKISENLKQLIKRDKRVVSYGFVSNFQLDRLLSECSFFIEPRNKEYKDFFYSFPSKILYYKKFSGIVFTNALSPMSPKMRLSFIDITNNYDAVSEVLSLEEKQLITLQNETSEMFITEMSRLKNELYEYIDGCT